MKQLRKEGAKGCLLIVLFMFLFALLIISITGGCKPLLDVILNRIPKLNAFVRASGYTIRITNFDGEVWEDVLVEINVLYNTKFDKIEPRETVTINCLYIDTNGIPKFSLLNIYE